ncbi:MAG: ABC transporter permease [Chloroflexi bacterium]|nr:ABC transporter permease [Chloroflexota bacterium]
MAAPALKEADRAEVGRSRSRQARLRRLVLRMGVRGVLGFCMVTAITLVAFLAPVLAPYDPGKQDYTAIMKPPSAAHLLGTDNLGRDVLTRVIYGAQASVRVGLMAVTLALVLGTMIGLPSGYFGGWVDKVIMGLMDAQLAFPGLVLALGITAALGPGLNNLIVAIGITATPTFGRLLRAQVLTLREREFIQAARCIGSSDLRIALRHILPNAVSPLIVQFSVAVGAAILTEANLSFLGLGVQPPAPSWGSMLREGYGFMDRAMWFPLSAGTVITLTVLGASFLGDSLRDLFDVRARADVL